MKIIFYFIKILPFLGSTFVTNRSEGNQKICTTIHKNMSQSLKRVRNENSSELDSKRQKVHDLQEYLISENETVIILKTTEEAAFPQEQTSIPKPFSTQYAPLRSVAADREQVLRPRRPPSSTTAIPNPYDGCRGGQYRHRWRRSASACRAGCRRWSALPPGRR